MTKQLTRLLMEKPDFLSDSQNERCQNEPKNLIDQLCVQVSTVLESTTLLATLEPEM